MVDKQFVQFISKGKESEIFIYRFEKKNIKNA